jgi:vacuolar-type H+-ATPase subunit I/STV1
MPFLGGFSPTLIHAQPASVFAVGQNITKTLATETVTIAESSHLRLVAKTRLSSSAESITIGESIARVKALIRSLATQTITVGESINRINAAIKTLSDTTSITGETIAKLITKARALGYTHSTGEALANLISKVRALATQTTSISDAVDKLVGVAGTAIEKTLSETELIAEVSMIRLKAAWRQQP